MIIFKNYFYIFCVTLGTVLGFNSSSFGQEAESLFTEDFDQKVLDEMELWKAPGMGLAIIRGGETVFLKGYGVKSIETNEPVDVDTLFQAASTTKAFASMALAMLVDEGKLKWDDPVKKHFPELKIKEPYVEENLTIRDILTHQSGVSSLSHLNGFVTEDFEESWKALAETEQETSFRRKHSYNNTIYALSGKIIENVSGKPFHVFIQERILDPLGMENTLLLNKDIQAYKNRADSHYVLDGKVNQAGYYNMEYSGAVGMINSTAEDMAKWMKFLVAGGQVNGQQLVSKKNFSEMIKIQVNIADIFSSPPVAITQPDYYAYGLGWYVYNYKGQTLVAHVGGINGMTAVAAFIPEKGVGVYSFMNTEESVYLFALVYQIFDQLLEEPSFDWSSMFYQAVQGSKQQKPKSSGAEEPLSPTPDQIVGTYNYPGLSAPLVISKSGETLRLEFGKIVGTIQIKDNQSYIFHTQKGPRHSPFKLNFRQDENGNVLMIGILSWGIPKVS